MTISKNQHINPELNNPEPKIKEHKKTADPPNCCALASSEMESMPTHRWASIKQVGLYQSLRILPIDILLFGFQTRVNSLFEKTVELIGHLII